MLFCCYVAVFQSDMLAFAKQEELQPKIREFERFCLFLTKPGESKPNQQLKDITKVFKQNFNKMFFISRSSVTKLHHNYGLHIGSLLIAFILKSLIKYFA